MSDPQTSDDTKVRQYKRRTYSYKCRTGTNVGRYKPKTYKRRTVQMSDQEKRRTGTNVGLVQTSDSTNDGPVQTSDR